MSQTEALNQVGYTKTEAVYPGYVNVTRKDKGYLVTVRNDPKQRSGAYVCGHTRDKGQPWRCTPGDENCNNYCNMAPDKGPMADKPKPCERFECGVTAAIDLTEEEWNAFLARVTNL